jgi:hypothetical protein
MRWNGDPGLRCGPRTGLARDRSPHLPEQRVKARKPFWTTSKQVLRLVCQVDESFVAGR